MGSFRQTAALFANISVSTLHDWLTLGRTELEDGATGDRAVLNQEELDADPGAQPALGPVETYAQFVQAVEDAEAGAEVRDLGLIQQAAEGSWQAAAWVLERKWRDRWGKPTLQVTGPEGAPIKVDASVDVKGGIVMMPELKEDA